MACPVNEWLKGFLHHSARVFTQISLHQSSSVQVSLLCTAPGPDNMSSITHWLKVKVLLHRTLQSMEHCTGTGLWWSRPQYLFWARLPFWLIPHIGLFICVLLPCAKLLNAGVCCLVPNWLLYGWYCYLASGIPKFDAWVPCWLFWVCSSSWALLWYRWTCMHGLPPDKTVEFTCLSFKNWYVVYYFFWEFWVALSGSAWSFSIRACYGWYKWDFRICFGVPLCVSGCLEAI